LVVHRDAFDGRTGYAGVDIKRRDDAKALRRETLVPEQCTAHVANSDHRDRPLPVGAENMADLRDQLMASVPNPGVTKVPEIGQVLANLGIGEAQHLAELAGANSRAAIANQMLQLSKVEA
jgi:hypothetical protein